MPPIIIWLAPVKNFLREVSLLSVLMALSWAPAAIGKAALPILAFSYLFVAERFVRALT
jgi:hypothetical protein